MADISSIPENVMIQHIFPCLNHHDLLRLRRVSKQNKALVDAFLWTPQPGHQGKWELKINPWKVNSLQTFLEMGLPPPSRLYIANVMEEKPSEQRSFFENQSLPEFMERYSKYVTHLKLDKLFMPFISAKEIQFYESLSNLEELCCTDLITVGGAAEFEKKTIRAEGSFLLRPTFKKLKSFKLTETDCLDSMWNLINGLSDNLEELSHPFQKASYNSSPVANIHPVRELIERRGFKNPRLLYDLEYLNYSNNLDLLGLFACCRDKGVFIKNLKRRHLDCIYANENGMIDREYLWKPDAGGWVPRVNYQRNLFVGSIIHSLWGFGEMVFLLELPALEEIIIYSSDDFPQDWPRQGYPEMPSLQKMHISLYTNHKLRFLDGRLKLLKLTELKLHYSANIREIEVSTIPRNLGNCCGNLKKLTINYSGGKNDWFVELWNELPLLEDVTLCNCWKLTNKGFIGDRIRGSMPAFLGLKKIKHLTIENLESMPRITNAAFKDVFRHLELSSFTLSSNRAITNITVSGIKLLLTGSFEKTIEKLDLKKLKLENVSENELTEIVNSFRCSKML